MAKKFNAEERRRWAIEQAVKMNMENAIMSAEGEPTLRMAIRLYDFALGDFSLLGQEFPDLLGDPVVSGKPAGDTTAPLAVSVDGALGNACQ